MADATGSMLESWTSGITDFLQRVGAPEPLPAIWKLGVQGGIFMIPIGICSIVVVAFAIERRMALRKSTIIPRRLLQELQQLNQDANGVDPRLAYDVCRKYKSPLSRIIEAAILKVGRPQAELEKAVEDAVDRESAELSRNLRPINTCISVAPLLGLLGTVQGMILAFMVISTTTATGAAKGQELAQGIYTALVTTFAGLCVAIPAIMIGNSLEGRIETLLRSMEDVFNEIIPLFERFEGKWRVMRKSDASGVILKGTSNRAEPIARPIASKGSSSDGLDVPMMIPNVPKK
jgi:biopolymer transport protein ExbB